MFDFEQDGVLYRREQNYIIVQGLSPKAKLEVVIPKEVMGLPVREIDAYAFQNMDIHAISLPASVLEIKSKAFYGCKKLEMINFTGERPQCYPTTAVGYQCFDGCTLLQHVYGTAQLELVGSFVFANCQNLKVMPPQIVGKVPPYSFEGCSSLKMLIFQNIKSVEAEAFSNCLNIEQVVVHKDFTYTDDFNDIMRYAQIQCFSFSKFANLVYEGYNVVIT